MQSSKATKNRKSKALLEKKLPEVLHAYVNEGKSLDSQSAQFGVSTRTLYRWLLSDLGDQQYRQVITDALINRIADADVELKQAADACQVARAREAARFARMDFERRRPHLYGQKQEITHQVAPILNISVAVEPQIAAQHDDSARVIDGESSQVIDNK